jgi:hypothetical protein
VRLRKRVNNVAQKDVFGFDELQKRWEKLENKWPNEVSRALKVGGGAMRTRMGQLSPKGVARTTRSGNAHKPGQLKKSWRLMPERYKVDGKYVVRFVRVQSTAPHAHLVELGHKLWVGGQGKGVPTVISFGGRTFNVKSPLSHQKGRVAGHPIKSKAKKEYVDKFGDDIEKLLDKLTREDRV